MLYLPSNVMSNILGFYVGFHQAKANIIARSWRSVYRKRLGRLGRPKLYESSFGWAVNGFSPAAKESYQKAFNLRTQKVGQSVMVIRGRHESRKAVVVRMTPSMLVLEDAVGKQFRVSRSSIAGAMLWGRRNEGGKRDHHLPEWWGRWIFTGIIV
jgi:hypothetical protein